LLKIKLIVESGVSKQRLFAIEKLLADKIILDNSSTIKLLVSPDNLKLVANLNAKLDINFSLDYTTDKVASRSKKNQKELIINAIEGKNKQQRMILDATAGWGRDSFLMASRGHKILLLEQNPLIYLLTKNAIDKLANQYTLPGSLAIANVAAQNYLTKLTPSDYPEVIYLDPMFPPRNKSALVKKEAQLLKLLTKYDTVVDLLSTSLTCCTEKVVVKRPINACYLDKIKPNWQVKGSKCRYDIYLPRRT